MASIPRPAASLITPYHAEYLKLVPEGDLVAHLERQGVELAAAFAALPEERGGYRYAPGKWTIKDVVGHIIDTERIMAYRLLRVGRGDQTPLPGFEQDDYVAKAKAGSRTFLDLAAEFRIVRAATLALVRSLEPEAWTRTGIASDNPVLATTLAHIIAGHASHHLDMLKNRYL
jgi:uncharacterized damage-inducible protein DinB